MHNYLGQSPAQTIFTQVSTKAASYSMTYTDAGSLIEFNSATPVSLNLLAVASAGQMTLGVKNKGVGILTIDPSGAETIDGSSTITLLQGESTTLVCNKVEWRSFGKMSSGSGATGGSSDKIFWENDQSVTANYSVSVGKNAMSAGPITINNGVTVTVPTGSTWTVV